MMAAITVRWLGMRLRRRWHVAAITKRLQCLRAEAALLADDIDIATAALVDTKEAMRQCEAEMHATMVPIPAWPRS